VGCGTIEEEGEEVSEVTTAATDAELRDYAKEGERNSLEATLDWARRLHEVYLIKKEQGGTFRKWAEEWYTEYSYSVLGMLAKVGNAHPRLFDIIKHRELPNDYRALYETTTLTDDEIADLPALDQKTIKDYKRQKRKDAEPRYVGTNVGGGNWKLHNVAFQELDVPESRVALIFTDPPYDRESLSLYSDMARQAATALIDGGSLLCYAGHYMVHEIIAAMSDHLTFWWMCAVTHGSGGRRFPGKNVFVGWKPLLWFVNGSRRSKDMISDIVKSEYEGKDDHEWQQSSIESTYYIQHLTHEGEIVYDPMAGSGTTLISAISLDRKAVGCEIDGERHATAMRRIENATESRQ
jgi:16S rRNA G966 N2-methylase RsmD